MTGANTITKTEKCLIIFKSYEGLINKPKSNHLKLRLILKPLYARELVQFLKLLFYVELLFLIDVYRMFNLSETFELLYLQKLN